jgi:tRNA nucleotidyltransferase (CCA-adding enzyme)
MTAGATGPAARLPIPRDPIIESVASRVAAAGGRALLVGGYVRDAMMGLESKDYDFEVYGLDIASLESVLASFGEVIAVGKAFGVLRVKGLDIDFSLPRRDSKTGRGHRGFLVEVDPSLSFQEASLRRDLTLNSMGLDPLTGEVLDPHGGREDIQRRVLRATDPVRFADDSLRGLRAAQFRARFEMEPDAELRAVCSALDLSDLPGERIFDELKKLLLKSRRPSLGFEFLREARLLRFFPELEAMVGVPQDPEWHPEGTVWEHTMLVVDEAAKARIAQEDEDLVVLLGALCHDLGKPSTTVIADGRVRSPCHEEEGVPIARSFLEKLRAPNDLIDKVAALVKHHLAPAQFLQGDASPRAYRRLARKLEAAGTSMRVLHRVASADHLGRTTPDALMRIFPAGDAFLRRAEDLAVEETGVKDVVLGRHLIARGYAPGPWFGKVLAECREVQDETGWEDADRILDSVLARRP